MYDFDILVSTKRGFRAEEHGILVRDGTVYLRVVGGNSKYTVMTATAGEDSGGPKPCRDKARLISAAIHLCSEYNIAPHFSKDSSSREFVNLFEITVTDDGEDDIAHLKKMCADFLAIFDAIGTQGNEGRSSDLVELYDAMAPDDSGDDVYLADGVWLSKNGLISDRGR